MSVVGIGCSWLLAAVFAVSSVGKLRSGAALRSFTRSVKDMDVLPAGAVGAVGVAVPVLEAVAAVALVVPATAVAGAVLALGLLAAFTVGVAAVLRRGTAASCLCFGVTERPFGPRHLVRNGFLIAVALLAAVASAVGGGAVEAAGVLLAVGVGLIVAVLIVMFDELVDLFGPSAPRPVR
ncbi:MauE/DoxX family redox-associated membrane protein [Pseudonocardia sp. TRM90224]|uniref:MauE/DoxX family redox-associated membrane protein n=1 Tax=Pseudonocardia sp. TRM90224 TaxID=2812678 RepID=UPI001E45DA45|nr:MauE/DoxX family redox-associated membrane protein [Pseudonocardia sp. TRM90224]